MLPWQQPEAQPEERMSTREKIEWVIIITAILALWPRIFLPADSFINRSMLYNVVLFPALLIALVVVFVTRLRRFHKAVHEQDPLKDDDRFES
jgi:hypothetical protein